VGGAGRTLQRLLELGIVEGRAVRVIRVAPLGDPIEVRLGDALLSLRRSEAASVEVAP
jgi:ferrous iron transport protein A